MKLFTRNDKIKNSSAYTVNFGIPALKTCPSANICKEYCYATKGAYHFPVVKNAQEERFKLSKSKEFINLVVNELSKIRKLEKVRIHDSGDFYNKEYLYKWIAIAKQFPHIEFYAYTKQVKLIKDNILAIPSNFTIIYSIGGKQDHLIDPKIDRHSKIFSSKSELKKAGYIDTSYDDTQAVNPFNHRVGLVIH